MSDEAALARTRADIEALRRRIQRLDPASLDLIFGLARNHNVWQDRDVPDALLREAFELARLGPTSSNGQPMRVVFVRSREAKARLKPVLDPFNFDKTLTAPVTAIVGYDSDYWHELPKLYVHDYTDAFRADPTMGEVHGFRNANLQAAFFIVALRALGLDCGAMSGFDEAMADQLFFAGTTIKSNFLINIGYGHTDGIYGPRLRRYEFDEVCQVV